MGSQIFLRRKNVSEKVLIGNTHCSTPSTSLTSLPSQEEEGEEEVLRGGSKKSEAFKNPHHVFVLKLSSDFELLRIQMGLQV
jgi:hypothetical protein